MTIVHEAIPEALQPQVDAAVAWFNERESETFSVTGILDPDASHVSSSASELRLVLCGGDRCEQRSFQVDQTSDGFEVAFAERQGASSAGREEPVAELDPPPGALRGWIDRVLPRHEFVVLLFYRGYW